MTSKELLAHLRAMVANASSAGIPGVSLVELDRILNDLTPATLTDQPDPHLQQQHLQAITFNREHAIETYKSLIAISVEALKTLLLLNGGALIALGTFVGAHLKAAESLHVASFLFLGGLVAVAVAFGTSYATQLALFGEAMNRRPAGSHLRPLYLTAAFAALSLGLFAGGAASAIESIRVDVDQASIERGVSPTAVPTSAQ